MSKAIEALDDLLDRYFAIAYQQGKDGRNHDDIKGSAQETIDKIRACFANCPRVPAALQSAADTPAPQPLMLGWQTRRPQDFLDKYPNASEFVMVIHETEWEARTAGVPTKDMVNGEFPPERLAAVVIRPVYASTSPPPQTNVRVARVRAIELLEWIEDYALADADLGEVASRAGDAIISLSALEDLLYHLEPFLAAAAVILDRPDQYQPTVARIGGISNARDLRVEDFRRLVSAHAALVIAEDM